ncbi:MAG: DUF4190 domain-containing protein [Clostridia bacterium]
MDPINNNAENEQATPQAAPEQTQAPTGPMYTQQAPPTPAAPIYTQQTPVENSDANGKSGMATASMVLGIISIVFGCCFYISLPIAIVGLVLGILSYKSNKSGMALAGIIMSSVAIVVTVIVIILGFSTAVFSNAFSRIESDFGDFGSHVPFN